MRKFFIIAKKPVTWFKYQVKYFYNLVSKKVRSVQSLLWMRSQNFTQRFLTWLRGNIWNKRKDILSWIKLWGWYKGWFILLIISLAAVGIFIWPGIEIPEVIDANGNERTQTLYLLSAISQSLAAVLALVFTISLIVAQLSSRYSHYMLASFFSAPIILYILLFIVAISLPFILLTKPNANAIKISLILTATCLLLLVPYFLSFKEKLNPISLINSFKIEAQKKVLKNPNDLPREAIIIDNFIISAFNQMDYETIDYGISSLGNIVMDTPFSEREYGGTNDQPSYAIASIIDRLANNGLITIQDPKVPYWVIDTLFRIGKHSIALKSEVLAGNICRHIESIGIKAAYYGIQEILMHSSQGGIRTALFSIGREAVDEGMSNLAISSGDSLRDVSIKCIQMGHEDTARAFASSLSFIGEKAVEKRLVSYTSFAIFLGTIGYEAVKYDLEEASGWVATFLGNLGAEGAEIGVEELSKDTANSLRNMGINATEKGLEKVLESVTKNLEFLGIRSIENNINNTPQFISSALTDICIKAARKEGLGMIYQRTVKFIIELGAYATLKNNTKLKEVIANELRRLRSTEMCYVPSNAFDEVRSCFSDRLDLQSAVIEFQDFYQKS